MKQQSFQSTPNIITGSIDICFHLTNLQNLTQFKLRPLSLSIKVFHSQSLIAIPYQIIPKSFAYTNSKIDLQTYSTQFFYLSADQKFPLDQIIIFKLHFPVNNLSKQSKQNQFKAIIQLKTIKNQLQFEEQLSEDGNKKVIDKFEVTFNSILYLSSYVPVIFENYGIALQATIYTHLLTCKYNNLFEVYRHQLYQTIDHLVICYNQLKEKIDKLNENINQNVIKNHYKEEYYENHQNQQQKLQQFNMIHQNNQNHQQLLPVFIDMNQYPQYSKIKQFIDKKICKDQQIKQHKTILISFIKKFIPQMSEKLLFLWKQFLNSVTIQFSQQYKYQYFQNLAIQLKKRVEFKYQRVKANQFNSIRRSKTNEINRQICSFSDTFFTEKDNFIAFNQLKQSYYDKNLHLMNEKLIISNQQIDYPRLKLLLSKSKQKQQSSMITQPQPHIIIFVHGLGASKSAFSLYQTYFKYIYGNILILNSCSNQKFTSQPIQQMSLKLTIQIHSFLQHHNIKQHFKLSFIGHSLGGLIIRAALPKLSMYKFNMKVFITLSTPHLGYFYHNSIINKAGMWALSKFSENYIMECLLMTDCQSNNEKKEEVYYRQSYLYNLSKQKGLAWFEDVLLFGCEEDQFVAPLSSIITTKKQIQTKKYSQSINLVINETKYLKLTQIMQCLSRVSPVQLRFIDKFQGQFIGFRIQDKIIFEFTLAIMNNHPYLALQSMKSNNIIQLPYNSQILLQKDLDITVKINSAYQTHPITFSCLLPKGTNQKRIRVVFTSKDDLFFLYGLDVDQQVIFGLNNDFGLKLHNLNDFLSMFNQLLEQIQNNIKKACLSYSNQNTLTLEINSIINGKQFLILRLIAQKQPNDVIQAWAAYKYGELKDSIGKNKIKLYSQGNWQGLKIPIFCIISVKSSDLIYTDFFNYYINTCWIQII